MRYLQSGKGKTVRKKDCHKVGNWAADLTSETQFSNLLLFQFDILLEGCSRIDPALSCCDQRGLVLQFVEIRGAKGEQSGTHT